MVFLICRLLLLDLTRCSALILIIFASNIVDFIDVCSSSILNNLLSLLSPLLVPLIFACSLVSMVVAWCILGIPHKFLNIFHIIDRKLSLVYVV